VAIGAFFIATGPFGLSIGKTLATVLRIAGVVLGYLGAMIDRPRLLQNRQDYSMTLQPGSPLPVVYGRAKVGGIVADWFIDPDVSQKILYIAVAVAHGSRDGLGIQSVERIWCNGVQAVTVATDVRVQPYGTSSLDYVVLLGATTQNVGNTQLTGLGALFANKSFAQVTNSGWSATTDTGKGIVCVIFRLLNVLKADNQGPTFQGPPSFSFIVNGNRVYDHRTDTWVTAGTNPSMCIRDYLLAPIYGCGYDPGLINEASFDAAADYCDTLVNYIVTAPVTITSSSVANPSVILTAAAHGFGTGTFLVRIAGHTGSTPSINGDWTATYVSNTQFSIPVNVTVGGTGGTVIKLQQTKRFSCNGVVDTGRPTADILQELLSSCRGNLVWEQGQFKLSIRSEVVAGPTVTLDPSIILGEWSFRNAGQEEKWNVVKASYIEPANGEFKVQEVQWPAVGTTNAYLAADNNFTNHLELGLPFTNDQLIAQANAQVTLNEARLGISAQVRCSEAALALSVGDKVYVTHPTPAWTAKQFWVTALQLMPDTTVSVSLQEYDPTAYDLSTMEDRRSFPATGLDSIFTVTAPGTVTAIGLATAGLLVTWLTADYGLIDYYEVQAKCTSCGDDYTTIGHIREGGTLQAVASLARPGQTWDSRVRVINVVGWPSAWVNGTQVTIPAPLGIAPGLGSGTWTGFAPTVVVSTTPPDITAASASGGTGGNLCTDPGTTWGIDVSWTVTGADDVHYETVIYVATDSAGTSFTILVTGLTTASSIYGNNTGVSGYTYGSPITYYRKYKVAIRRKSDGVDVDSALTGQRTLTVDPNGSCNP